MSKNNFLVLIISIVVLSILLMFFSSKENRLAPQISQIINNYSLKNKQNVIFDLGANIGDSARLFADPTFNCDQCHELKGICFKDNKKWIMHSFEANPRYNNILDNVSKIIESYGHTHILYKQSAAWVQNGNLTFYLDLQASGWGTSAHAEFAHSQTKVIAKAYDISEIIDQYSYDDYIVVKIDIEGTEFPLFEHFLRQGTINKIDYIAIEFHNIYKNSTFWDKIKFFKTYLQTVKKPYSQWFMGHGKFLGDDIF